MLTFAVALCLFAGVLRAVVLRGAALVVEDLRVVVVDLAAAVRRVVGFLAGGFFALVFVGLDLAVLDFDALVEVRRVAIKGSLFAIEYETQQLCLAC